uniref:Uncharacterized protein n=1 Tax=Amphimedon queenslandica TaxID=400682 RepID=A0A1X7U492_AMPQE
MYVCEKHKVPFVNYGHICTIMELQGIQKFHAIGSDSWKGFDDSAIFSLLDIGMCNIIKGSSGFRLFFLLRPLCASACGPCPCQLSLVDWHTITEYKDNIKYIIVKTYNLSNHSPQLGYYLLPLLLKQRQSWGRRGSSMREHRCTSRREHRCSSRSTGAPPGGSTGAPPGGSTGAPPGGSTGAPPGGSTGAPLGRSTGAPPGESTGAPSGGSTGATLGASTGGPPALRIGMGSAGGGGGGGGLPSPATGGGG